VRARKVDANSKNLLSVARQLGLRVFVNNDALCDAIVQAPGGHTELWEVKDKKGRFTDLQKRMREAGWHIRTVKTVDDVVLARSEMTRAGAEQQKARMG
jgi:hypothetical protein